MAHTPCRHCPLRRKPLFTPFTADELAFMEAFKEREVHLAPGQMIVAEGTASPHLFTVLVGMGTRSTLLADGRRQVINFLFPGDFIGLQAGIMGETKHSAHASTPMTLCVFSRAKLWEMYRAHPERAFDLTWIAAVEEHFLGETIATLGQRDAGERMAWALLRMYQRLVAIDLGRNGRVPLPFRQQDLADALGLSLVHTNKTLARMRTEGLADWSRKVLHIPDLARLARYAGVDLDRADRRPIL